MNSTTPRRPTKRARTAASSSSSRPSKVVQLSYRQASRQTPDQKRRYPATARTPPATRTTPKTKMMLISAVEVSLLRENNVFLRTQNVELAKAYRKAKDAQTIEPAPAAPVNPAAAAADADTELNRLKRQMTALMEAGAGGAGGPDAEALSKRIVELEEVRKVYYECCIQWATLEKQWTTERALLRNEVQGLVGRVQGLEGELQEERVKTRGYEGHILDMQRQRSVARAGSVKMEEGAGETIEPSSAVGGLAYPDPTLGGYGASVYGTAPAYGPDPTPGPNMGMAPTYDQQGQTLRILSYTELMADDGNMDDEGAGGYEEQGQAETSGQWDFQG